MQPVKLTLKPGETTTRRVVREGDIEVRADAVIRLPCGTEFRVPIDLQRGEISITAGAEGADAGVLSIVFLDVDAGKPHRLQ